MTSPHTDHVRFAYVDRECFVAQLDRVEPKDDADYAAEFDNWLDLVRAEAWDEGRESIGHDLLRGLDGAGLRPSTPNPYRRSQ